MARNYPTGADRIKAFKRNPHYFTDYFGQNTNSGNAYQLSYAPLTLFTAVTTGTMLAHTSDIPSNAVSPKHPGTATMRTNAANTESGGSLQTGNASIILGTALTSFSLIF
jgi:hypothetical protein